MVWVCPSTLEDFHLPPSRNLLSNLTFDPTQGHFQLTVSIPELTLQYHLEPEHGQ